MGLSYDVRLSKSVQPVYPDRCVACGRPKPVSSVRVTTHAIGWWTIVFLHPGRSFRAFVPACEPCARRLRRQRWMRLVLYALCLVPAVALALYLIGSYHGPFRKYIGVGVALLCLAPLFIWEALHAPPVDLTAYSEEVDYEFADPEYAREFATLNGGTVE